MVRTGRQASIAAEDALPALGALEIPHVAGPLLDHLTATRDLLRFWGSRPALCHAGLYHAVYGTAGFATPLVAPTRRAKIVAIIGAEAEAIVFTFAACDRAFFYGEVRNETHPLYRDRFTRSAYRLSDVALRDLCELTMANQLEIARHEPGAPTRRDELVRTLGRMRPWVSAPAFAEHARIFAIAA